MNNQNLSQKDALIIYQRYKRIKGDCTWTCWDDFLQWAVDNGWGKGFELRKHDEDKPHGPKNSYFYSMKEEIQKKHEKVVADRAIVSRFCVSCDRQCPSHGTGCEAWRENFVQNWDKNIHVFSPEPEISMVRMKFRYEHPDLIREGRAT